MKRLSTLIMLLLAIHAMAQEPDQPLQRGRVVTNGLLNNWFVQAGVQWNENGVWKPFQGKVAVGKWWSPSVGTRAALTGLQGNCDALSIASFREGGCVLYPTKDHFSHLTISGDVLFNLTNIFMGYQDDRLWNFIPFAGPAVARNCSSGDYALGLQLGLLNTFRLNRRLSAHLEVGWQRLEASFADRWAQSRWGNHARRCYAEVGLTLNIGKQTGWQKAPDVEAVRLSYEAEIEALNAQLEDANAEIERLSGEE